MLSACQGLEFFPIGGVRGLRGIEVMLTGIPVGSGPCLQCGFLLTGCGLRVFSAIRCLINLESSRLGILPLCQGSEIFPTGGGLPEVEVIVTGIGLGIASAIRFKLSPF